jgi:hypothetical protein
MALFKRRTNPRDAATADVPASTEGLLEEIARLAPSVRTRPDLAARRRLLALRHAAGLRLVDDAAPGRGYPEPDRGALGDGAGLPEIAAADLTAPLLRAGILRDGCLLVRGLVDRDDALAFAGGIDRAFAEREALEAGGAPGGGHYEEFTAQPPLDIASVRPWIKEGGGILAADSPVLFTRMVELFEDAGLPRLAEGYLGERAVLSVQKTTLRKAEPTVGGSWHQDGAFMSGARALNLWLSLSRCGDEAPGLDIVPRRLDEIVVAHGDMLDRDLTEAKARAAAGDVAIARPIFEAGDALLFDEMFLHQTGSDPAMRNPRFAVESWFFAASAFPPDYAPLAV